MRAPPTRSLHRRASFAAGMIVALHVAVGVAWAEDDGDLRDLRVGMAVGAIPAGEYVDLACAASPERKLTGFDQFGDCPADPDGQRAVTFHFNEKLNPLAQVNDKYEGTKVAGHPVVLTLVIDAAGTVDRLRIDTDPQARLFLRKKAHLLALVVKSRYGEDGWTCHDAGPVGGETPVGGVFVNQHCEKAAAGRSFALDRAVYRRPGQSTNDFVNETHLEIRRARP
jgi:hypothetical protein